MRTRVILALAMALGWTASAAAQSAMGGQPVTVVGDYYVRPGKEEEFLNLVKAVAEPAYGKLMADGVVLAWGVGVPLLHAPGAATHNVWFSVADMGGVEKALAALQEQIGKLEAEEKKAAEEAAKKKGRPAVKSLAERFQDAADSTKHKDWLFRSVVMGGSGAPPPAGTMPYSWISITRVLPGQATEYRQLWEKYVRPVYDKLVADGAILGYELGTEETRTTDDFSHFTLVSLPNLAAREKVRAAFNAANEARSEETRKQITQSFLGVIDPAASRAFILRTVVFHAGAPPK